MNSADVGSFHYQVMIGRNRAFQPRLVVYWRVLCLDLGMIPFVRGLQSRIDHAVGEREHNAMQPT